MQAIELLSVRGPVSQALASGTGNVHVFCVAAKLILDSSVICVVWGSPECTVYSVGTQDYSH